MKKVSGQFHIVDFQTEKIIAVLQPKDYYDDLRHWELKNNIDTLTFKILIDNPNTDAIIQQNLILRETRDGRFIPYVIDEAIQTKDGRFIEVFSSAVWVEIAQSGIIKQQRIEGKTVNEFIDMALIGMKWKRGKTDYAGFHTMTIDEFIDPLTFLGKIASLFNLEIQYRVEVFANKIVGWYVDMIAKRGRYTGKEINLGKDLINVRRIENTRNICTALVGFVRGEGDSIITIESINNGLPYIVDNEAFQRWNVKGFHRFGFYTPETDNQNMTQQRLLTLMEMEMKKRKAASVSYEVDAQNLARVKGFEHEQVGEGDTIVIKDPGFKPKLYLEARVIAGDESFKNPTAEKYLFGNYREITDPNEEMRKLYNRLLGQLTGKANKELLAQLEKLVEENGKTIETIREESKAVKELAEKVQENLKNNTVNIIESKNPPTDNLIVGKTLWRDISNGKPGILKMWNGNGWELLIPDVEAVKKETLEQVNTQIESTKKELNTKVADVQKEAQAIAGQISDVKKEVQGKVDSNFVKEQIKDKADKSGVFTRDEINNGFIGKQIYETDKQGNVKKFQEISTSFEQTNEAIKSKAEKQSVTDLGNNLSQVSKTANEAKQTAEGTQQTITELKATVENAEIGVRNLLLETAIKSHSVKTGENKPHTYFDVAKDAATLMQGKNLAMSFLFTGKVTAWGTTNKWAGFEVKITFTDNTFHYPSCRVENRLTLGKQYNQEIFTATAVVMDKPIKEITVYALGRDFTGEMLIEKPKLEIGTVPTAWTPAPEDQVTTSDFTKKTVEIEENINGIKNAVSTVQNEQGKLTERVTKSEQTADGFKQSIESLTKKDNDISNKLNTVEQTVEGTKKTITDVQQTTNDLKKTTTEITEKAGKISEKLESIEKKVTNDKAGGRNLLLDSNVKYEKADYLINQYTLSENFSAGEEYTFVIKGSVPQGQKFGIWQNGGSNNVGYATSAYASGITYVTFKAVATTVGNEKKLSLYSVPQNTTKSTVEWVALYKGNKPQDWTPAPENQVTNDDFTKKTNEIIKSVEGTTETIKKVEKTQGDFSERVNTVEKNAEGFNQSVKKLQETQTQQGKQLTEAATTIEQHTEALNLSLKMKDVEEYVGGLNYINLILNSVLKENTKNWSLHTGTIRDASVLYKGAVSFRTITTGLTEDSYRGAVQTIINNGTDWDFVYSAYFYTDNKASLDKGSMVEVICLDGNGNRLKTYQQEITLTQGIWVRSFVTGQVVAGTKSIQAKHWIRRNGRLWAAQPQFQMGIKPASFMENPSDIVDKDKLIELIGDKVATEDYNKKIDVFERDIKATKDGIEISSKRQETFINETYAAYVKETGSKIKVLDEGILAQVIKNGIITAINMSPGKITIDAAKLEINADTMVKWLTAKGIDTNVINVNGDKITIDKNGVTVKMLDFLFQDEWGTKTTAVSRRNLIADPDFSSVGKKNIGHADYYGFEGGYGLTWKSQGNVVIEKNTSVFDYEQMVNAARVDMYNYPEAVVNNGIHPGNEYTVSAHFRTSMINGVRKTAKPRLHVCCVKFRDNVSYDIWNEQKMDFPEPSTFYGEIRRYSFTFKVPTNYKPQEHALIIKVCSANGQITGAQTAICVSGVTLYSGKYASMYNWDRAAAERAAGLQPFNSIAVGSVNNNIGPAPDGQTFDISTEKDVKFFTNIRAVQGVNLGGNAFQGWGHIRFTDGNLGPGFYVSSANGWKFNALG